MSFLRGLGESANKKIIDTETLKLDVIKQCWETAWIEIYGDKMGVEFPSLFVLGDDGLPGGSGGLTSEQLSIVPFNVEKMRAGDLGVFAIDIVKLAIDFQQTPQCPKRIVFGNDKWNSVSMLVLEELKGWCIDRMYSLESTEDGLAEIFLRICFMENLLSRASEIFISSNGEGVNDALRSLLSHLKSFILEDKAAPTMITVLEDAHHASNPPKSGRGSKSEDKNDRKLVHIENMSKTHIYLPDIDMYFGIDGHKHKVCFVSSKYDAATFTVMHKSIKEPNVFGLRDEDSECFLFSPCPMTSALHGPCGGESLYCRYKKFRKGEQFVFIGKGIVGDGENKQTYTGIMQHYYNHKYWGVSENRMKIKMVKDVSSAVVVEFQGISE